MTALTRRWRAATLLAGLTLALAACGGGAEAPSAQPGGGDPDQPVTLTWWHNGTADPGKSYYQSIAAAYHQAHPNVTIKVQPLQNEQFNTKIPVALQSNSPPDVFQQWGGGQLAEQVEAGKVQDLTEAAKPWIGSLGPAVGNWQVDGRTYGIPYSFGIVGFWYDKAVFQKAGIASPPATWEELLDAAKQLKAAGVAPIAIGSKDKWPDAFYWDYLALRLCSQEVMQQSATEYNFDDPCWARAGELVEQLIDAQPFQKGFLATTAQQGAGSSAGLLANGKAAMELQGHWNPGVMQGLTPDKKPPEGLGWFPFPSVAGGAGKPDAALGGGDGFSCSFKAPPACADFLKFLVSVENQRRFGELGIGLPLAAGSEDGVADPNLKALLEFRNKASFVQTYLDVAYGSSVGQALNDAIAQQFAGQLDPAGVVAAVKEAAASR